MAPHEKFNFRSLDQITAKVAELGVDIRFDEDLSPLARPVQIGGFTAPNSLGVHPMEGCDGNADGSPAELTIRRYDRFAAGGAGVLWFEATAVVPEGRANPRQLWIHDGNVGEFAKLVERIRRTAREQYGKEPVTIIQLTHSGRHSRPVDKPAPVIAQRNPVLDPRHKLPNDYPIASDDYLESLEDRFVQAAKLAQRAGFDGVDIKATHGYLLAELLGARMRPGRYGGSFENRTRLMVDIASRVRQEAPDLLLASRIWAYDYMDYPYSWGMDEETPGKLDLSETIELCRRLQAEGLRLLNVSGGNPYFNPHVNRPYDLPSRGVTIPEEHPLEGVARLLGASRDIQNALPELAVMGTGFSWLRQFFPMAAAASLRDGWMRVAGLGREAFAYPDFARDLLEKGELDLKKTCTACSKCVQLMRDDGMAGCVTKDSKVYLPIYRSKCEGR